MRLTLLIGVAVAVFWIYGKYDDMEERTLEQAQWQTDLRDFGWLVREEVEQANMALQGISTTDFSNLESLIQLNQSITPDDFAYWQLDLQWEHGLDPSPIYLDHDVAEGVYVEWQDFLALWDFYNDLSQSEQEAITWLYLQDRFERGHYWIHIGRTDWNESNLQIFAIDHETGETIGEGFTLLQELYETGTASELEATYADVWVLNFDEEGNQSIPFAMGEALYLDFDYSLFFSRRTPRNQTFVIGLPHELTVWDSILQSRNWQMQVVQREVTFTTALPAIIGVALLAILIPIKIVRKGAMWNVLLRFPLEGIFFAGIYIAEFFYIELHRVVSSYFREAPTFTWEPLATEHNLIIVGNLIVWGLFFGGIVYGILYVKYLFVQGIGATLTKNTLLIGLPFGAYRAFKQADLSRETVARQVAIHTAKGLYFLVLLFVVLDSRLGLELGLAGLGLYVIASFGYQVRDKQASHKGYLQLLKSSETLASGELDLEGDFGPYTSMKEHLQHIHDRSEKVISEAVSHEQIKTNLLYQNASEIQGPLLKALEQVKYLQNGDLEVETRTEIVEALTGHLSEVETLVKNLQVGDKIRLVDTEIVGLLESALDQVEGDLLKTGLAVRTQFPEKPVLAKADSQRLGTIFQNLVQYIVRESINGTRAYLSVERGEQVQVTFRHMSEQMPDFEKLQQLLELQGGTFTVQRDGDLVKITLTLRGA